MRKLFLFVFFISFGFQVLAGNSFNYPILRSLPHYSMIIMGDTIPLGNQPLNRVDTLGKDSTLNLIDYDALKEYTVDTVVVTGTKYLDNSLLVNISRLRSGMRLKLPGDEKLTGAIKNLWAQGLFEDVKLNAIHIGSDHLTIQIQLVERPRLGRYEFHGMAKSAEEDIRTKLKGSESRVLTENLLSNTERVIKKYFNDKGYLNCEVRFNPIQDPNVANKKILEVFVKEGKKARVDKINFIGNLHISNAKLRKSLKETKQKEFYKIFGSKKFILSKYQEDKDAFIKKFSDLGYRDAKIVSDTIIHNKDGNVTINMNISEGPKYYFGNINWVGNTRYTAEQLSNALGIHYGDVYNQGKLEKRLNKGEAGDDVSSLYLDFGYLFFHVEPTETNVHQDTVDLEMRLVEGAQADYNRITIKGNTRTNDKVILRQLKTKPGEKFSKSQVVRTVRELATLGYFDEQKINPAVNPNQNDGTVDIEYQLEEKPSDQVELSGGFGGGKIIGSLGLSFNNFSIQKLFKGNWEGLLPQGDGQKISIKASANGKQYQVYNLSFSEPWFGGHKPITFGVNLSTSLLSSSVGVPKSSPSYRGANISSLSFSLAKQLRFPDDYFSIQYGLTFAQYILSNYPGFIFNTGTSYTFSLSQIISRNSIDQPIYPTSGSNIRFSIELTPPYSAWNHVDYANTNITLANKFRFTEYHKWKIDASWFVKLYGKLVLNSAARFGFVGFYNNYIGVPQLNRFLLGGDGLQGFNFLQSTEIIGLRGYQNYSILPQGGNPNSGSPLYNKFTFELRHPLTTSQSATIYMLGFLEGGNTYNSLATYSPFNLHRSAGLGLRIYLPIFGLLGLDYGYGFDQVVGNSTANKGQFHFTINKGLDGF